MESRLKTVKAITAFIFEENRPLKSDLIIVPGSSHYQLAKKAAQLYLKGLAPEIILTGGFNLRLNQAECDFGRAILLKHGVSDKTILCEKFSSNSKENAQEAYKLAKKHSLKYRRILLVCKPYHARRLKMTFAKVFTKSRLLVIPVRDERNITKYNWWKSNEKRDKIMEELGKISEYFLKGDLSL